jgi:hypothetical protein
VSNHGGRILDGAPATAAALPRVADALGGRLPLLADGGLRCGADVLKALALGANAVLLGRPVLHGLATAGAAGAAHVLRLVQDELALAWANAGSRPPPGPLQSWSILHMLDLPQGHSRKRIANAKDSHLYSPQSNVLPAVKP